MRNSGSGQLCFETGNCKLAVQHGLDPGELRATWVWDGMRRMNIAKVYAAVNCLFRERSRGIAEIH
jgi:hypothetical protein